MPFKILSAATLAVLSLAQVNTECFKTEAVLGNANTSFDAVDNYDSDIFPVDPSAISQLLWGNAPQVWIKTCKSSDTNYNFRSIQVGHEQNYKDGQTEPKEADTMWGNVFGAVTSDDGKDPNGKAVTCELNAVTLTSTTTTWRSSNYSKSQKGGIYNMILNWEDADGNAAGLTGGIYTKSGTTTESRFGDENVFMGFWGRNEKLRPQSLGYYVFTPTDACKEMYPKPLPPTYPRTDTSKMSPIFTSVDVNPIPEEASVWGAVGALIGLFVAFIIFLVLIRWDNTRVHAIRNRAKTDKKVDQEAPETERNLNN